MVLNDVRKTSVEPEFESRSPASMKSLEKVCINLIRSTEKKNLKGNEPVPVRMPAKTETYYKEKLLVVKVPKEGRGKRKKLVITLVLLEQ